MGQYFSDMPTEIENGNLGRIRMWFLIWHGKANVHTGPSLLSLILKSAMPGHLIYPNRKDNDCSQTSAGTCIPGHRSVDGFIPVLTAQASFWCYILLIIGKVPINLWFWNPLVTDSSLIRDQEFYRFCTRTFFWNNNKKIVFIYFSLKKTM